MRNEKEFLNAIELKKQGLNNSEISKLLNIPRTTISGWCRKSPNFKKINELDPKAYISDNNLEKTYSYILGLYLGDGYINKMPRTYKLRIFNDAQYTDLNRHIINQLRLLFPKNQVSFIDRNTMFVIYVHSNMIPKLFPQDGIGKKHCRKIKLLDWQKEVLIPQYMVMGLIHSDGCYYFRTVNNKKYYSYDFTNKSYDIHQIFQDCCDEINVKYTFPDNPKSDHANITHIYKNEDVTKLLTLIGDKTHIIWQNEK